MEEEVIEIYLAGYRIPAKVAQWTQRCSIKFNGTTYFKVTQAELDSLALKKLSCKELRRMSDEVLHRFYD